MSVSGSEPVEPTEQGKTSPISDLFGRLERALTEARHAGAEVERLLVELQGRVLKLADALSPVMPVVHGAIAELGPIEQRRAPKSPTAIADAMTEREGIENVVADVLGVKVKEDDRLPTKDGRTCDLCGFVAAKSSGLLRHLRETHNRHDSDAEACRLCGKAVSKSYVVEHMRRIHKIPPPNGRKHGTHKAKD